MAIKKLPTLKEIEKWKAKYDAYRERYLNRLRERTKNKNQQKKKELTPKQISDLSKQRAKANAKLTYTIENIALMLQDWEDTPYDPIFIRKPYYLNTAALESEGDDRYSYVEFLQAPKTLLTKLREKYWVYDHRESIMILNESKEDHEARQKRMYDEENAIQN
jgi:hypothetical protein